MIWREQESSGMLRIPEESGVNTGIHVTQEFLRKNPVKSKKKTGITATPSKPRSCEKFLRNLQEEK